MEVIRCNPDNYPEDPTYCREDLAVDRILNKIFFTVYYIDENVEFGNPLNIGKNPVAATDTFHSQFQLNKA